MYDIDQIRLIEKEKYGISYPKFVEDIRESFFQTEKYSPSDIFYYALGGAVFAPLYVGFCKWAIETAKLEGIHAIFPLMREGILYDKILKIIIESRNEDMKSEPIWVSRKSSYGALCYGNFNYDFFIEMCMGYPQTIESCFGKLGISMAREIYAENHEQINKAIQNIDEDMLRRIYEKIIHYGLEEIINEKINRTKSLMRQYLVQCGATENFLTLDIGSMGTLPQAIDNCLETIQKKIHLFLVANPPVVSRIERGHDIRFFFKDFDPPLLFSSFSLHLVETITMGNVLVGTAIGYKKGEDGTISVINALGGFRNTNMRRTISIIQDGIVDFAKIYMKQNIKNISCESNDLIKNGVNSFLRLVHFPLIEEAEKIGFFEYDESVDDVKIKFIQDKLISENHPLYSLPKGDIDLRIYDNKQNTSAWAEGALIIKKKYLQKKYKENIGLRRIAIYGFGFYGKRTLEVMQKYDVYIVCVIDKKMAGEYFETIPIISVENLCQYDVTDIIVGSHDYKNEIHAIIDAYAERWGKKYIVHNIIV